MWCFSSSAIAAACVKRCATVLAPNLQLAATPGDRERDRACKLTGAGASSGWAAVDRTLGSRPIQGQSCQAKCHHPERSFLMQPPAGAPTADRRPHACCGALHNRPTPRRIPARPANGRAVGGRAEERTGRGGDRFIAARQPPCSLWPAWRAGLAPCCAARRAASRGRRSRPADSRQVGVQG